MIHFAYVPKLKLFRPYRPLVRLQKRAKMNISRIRLPDMQVFGIFIASEARLGALERF